MRITRMQLRALVRASARKGNKKRVFNESMLRGALHIPFMQLIGKYGTKLVRLAQKIIKNPKLLNDMLKYAKENHPEEFQKSSVDSAIIDNSLNEAVIESMGALQLLIQVVSLLSVPAILGFVQVQAQVNPTTTVPVTSPRGSPIRSNSIVSLDTPGQKDIQWPDGVKTTPAADLQNKKVGWFVTDKGEYHLEAHPQFFNDPTFVRPISNKTQNVYKKIGQKYYVRVELIGGVVQAMLGATAQSVAGHFIIDYLRSRAGYNIPIKTDPRSHKPYRIATTGTSSGKGNIEDCEIHFNLDSNITSTISQNPVLKKNEVFKIEVKNTSIGWSDAAMEFDLGMVFGGDMSRVKVLNGMDKGMGGEPDEYSHPFLSQVVDENGNKFALDFWGNHKGKTLDDLPQTAGQMHIVPASVRSGDAIAQGVGHTAEQYTQPSQAGMQNIMPPEPPSGRVKNVETVEEVFRFKLARALKKSTYKDHVNVPFKDYKIPDIVAYLKLLMSSIIGNVQVLAHHTDQDRLRGALPMIDKHDIDKYLDDFDIIIDNYKTYLTAVKKNEMYVSRPGAGLLSGDALDSAAIKMQKFHIDNWNVKEYGKSFVGTGVGFATQIPLKTYDENAKFPPGAFVKLVSGPGGIHSLKGSNVLVGKVVQSSTDTARIVVELPAPRVSRNSDQYYYDPNNPKTYALLAGNLEKIDETEYKKISKLREQEYTEAKERYEEALKEELALEVAYEEKLSELEEEAYTWLSTNVDTTAALRRFYKINDIVRYGITKMKKPELLSLVNYASLPKSDEAGISRRKDRLRSLALLLADHLLNGAQISDEAIKGNEKIKGMTEDQIKSRGVKSDGTLNEHSTYDDLRRIIERL